MITISSETDRESRTIQEWIENNVKDSVAFKDCCHSKKCKFKIEMKYENTINGK